MVDYEKISLLTGSDPVAGAEVSITVPSNEAWEVFGVFLDFTTSATVANRNVRLVVDDGTTVFARIPANFDQPASFQRFYSFFTNAGSSYQKSAEVVAPLPYPLVLRPGWRITTSTANKDAGDNFAVPVVYYRKRPNV